MPVNYIVTSSADYLSEQRPITLMIQQWLEFDSRFVMGHRDHGSCAESADQDGPRRNTRSAKPGPQPMPCGCQNAPNRFVFEAERRRDAKSLAKPQFCFPHRNTLTCVRVCVRGGGSVRGSHQLMVQWMLLAGMASVLLRSLMLAHATILPNKSESIAVSKFGVGSKTVPSTGCWLNLQPTAARTTTPT